MPISSLIKRKARSKFSLLKKQLESVRCLELGLAYGKLSRLDGYTISIHHSQVENEPRAIALLFLPWLGLDPICSQCSPWICTSPALTSQGTYNPPVGLLMGPHTVTSPASRLHVTALSLCETISCTYSLSSSPLGLNSASVQVYLCHLFLVLTQSLTSGGWCK